MTNENKKDDLVILFSGGSDSRLMLEIALANRMKPYCILINYGQAHKEELEFAKKQLEERGVNYGVYDVNIPVNSGLTGSLNQSTYEGVHSHHVPGRNLIFLSLAASVAEARNISKIWYGPDFSDRINLFPDCYQEWVVKVREVLNINGSVPLELEAPLLGMTKELILSTLVNVYGVDINKDIYSGYGEYS